MFIPFVKAPFVKAPFAKATTRIVRFAAFLPGSGCHDPVTWARGDAPQAQFAT